MRNGLEILHVFFHDLPVYFFILSCDFSTCNFVPDLIRIPSSSAREQQKKCDGFPISVTLENRDPVYFHKTSQNAL